MENIPFHQSVKRAKKDLLSVRIFNSIRESYNSQTLKSNKINVINDQMRNYEGSQEYQQMMRGEKVKKEAREKDKSKNLLFLQKMLIH